MSTFRSVQALGSVLVLAGIVLWAVVYSRYGMTRGSQVLVIGLGILAFVLVCVGALLPFRHRPLFPASG